MKFFVFIALALVATACVSADPTAFVSVDVSESLINKGLAFAKDIVINKAKQVVVPGQSGSFYNFNSFGLSQFDIGSIQANYVATNTVSFAFKNIDISIPNTGFGVHKKILWHTFGCSGTFNAKISNTDLYMTFPLIRAADGTLQFGTVGTTFNFGSLKVDHHLDGFFCKVGNAIINTFVMNINNKITSEVKEKVPSLASGEMTSILNNFFTHLDFHMHTQPAVVSNHLKLTWDAVGNGQYYDWIDFAWPNEVKTLAPRDITTSMDVTSANTLLGVECSKGVMNYGGQTPITTSQIDAFLPGSEALCKGCPVKITLSYPDCTTPPTVSFANGEAKATVTGAHMDISATNGATDVPIASFVVVGSFGLKNFATSNGPTMVKFQVDSDLHNITVTADHTSNPINPSMFSMLINKIAVPLFNSKFPGVVVPNLPFGTVSDIEIQASDNLYGVGLDVAFSGSFLKA